MKPLIKYTDYAIMALCEIANDKDSCLSSTELSKRLKIPRPFLRRILQRLSTKKILSSCGGKGGGFTLATPANRINLLNLIEMLQGHVRLNNCTIQKRSCPRIKKCFLRKKIDEIENDINSELKSLTIKSMLN